MVLSGSHDDPDASKAGDEPVPWAASDEDDAGLYRLADIDVDEGKPDAPETESTQSRESVPWFEEGAGQDYELEDVDADVLEGERQRAAERIVQVQRRAAIEELYDQSPGDFHGGHPDQILQSFRFRFRIKDLMILTAVVAIVLTVAKLTSPGLVLLFLILVGAGGPLAYFEWKEYRRQQAFDRKRRKLLAELRRDMAANNPHKTAAEEDAGQAPSVAVPPIGRWLEEERPEAARWLHETEERFRFRFSMKQLVGAVTVAAIVFGLAQFVGGPVNMASLLGLVALLGLVLHVAGFEVPEVVAFAWWVLLLLYILMSLLAVFVPSF